MKSDNKFIGYAYDVKPAVNNMEEFKMIDYAMDIFVHASGCRLHRDPSSMKCKLLPLAKWRNTLKQEDIPCPYMTLTDELDMVGVEQNKHGHKQGKQMEMQYK